MPKKAVFIDRDGTINEEVGYLGEVERLVLIPGAIDAVRSLNEAGYEVVVITNQAGVARGYFDEDAVRQIHRHLFRLFADGGARITAIYYCPHHPDFPGDGSPECNCRKPAPGMLERAAADFDLDLSMSVMVGDTVKDMHVGKSVGCKTIMVETGYGLKERKELDFEPDYVAQDLAEAASWIIGEGAR